MKKVKLLARVIAGLISLILLAVLFLVIYVEINKESLTQYIISRVNENIEGEITIGRIAFNPIVHFPHQSISLSQVKVKDIDSVSVIDSERVYLAVNVFSLFKDTIQIYGLELENAKAELRTTEDNELNIISIFSGSSEDDDKSDEESESNILASGIIPESIILDNVLINYSSANEKQVWSYYIDQMETDYFLYPDTVDFAIELNSRVINFPITEKLAFQDKDFSFKSSISLIMNDSLLSISKTDLRFDNTEFELIGNLYFSDTDKSRLEFSLVDDNGIASLLEVEEASKKFSGGNINIKGIYEFDPVIDLSFVSGVFGINDLNISDRNSGSSIKGINLTGSFSTGTDKAKNGSGIIIDTLFFQSGSNRIDAKLSLRDFNNPALSILLAGDQDLKTIGNIFDLPHMEGKVSAFLNIKGRFNNDTWFPENNNSMYLGFSDITTSIADLIPLTNLNGSISGTMENLFLDSLRFQLGRSDYHIQGDISGIQNLLTNNNSRTNANIKLKSNLFVLGELLEWIPTADAESYNRSFPYDFKDVYVSAATSFTSETFRNFRIMPQFAIDVEIAKATIDGFLPPVEASNGVLEFIVPDSILLIDIRNFDVRAENTELNGGCTYFSRPGMMDSLTVDANIVSVSPEYLLGYYDTIDQNPETFFTIAGNYMLGMNFTGFDTLVNSRFTSLVADNVAWRTKNDTLAIGKMSITIDSVYYNKAAELGPLSELGASILTELDDIKASTVSLEKLNTNIYVKQGVFDFKVVKSTSLLQSGNGKLILAPFVEKPFYNLEYRINGFQFEELYKRLNQPAALKGQINADIKLAGTGKDKKELASNINGYIKFDGKDLQLIGINLDNVIRKLNRTQNFNLVDIGAVVVAGPVGLLITKGSDLTSLLMINTNDSTKIEELVSDWNVANGELLLSDVAFSTNNNRIAAKGNYSFVSDSLNIVIAVIDEKGHIQLHQTIYGKSSNPEFSAIKPLKSLLKPVENLLVDVLMIDGDVFYNGKVKPSKK